MRRDTFGPYELSWKLASGGMADVFVAKMRGAGGFEKRVVLKMPLAEYASSAEVIEQLIAEAKLAARFDHPNIVRVIDLVCVDGRWALVLEHIDGVDLFQLREALEEHDRLLGVDEAVHIAKEILAALDFLHGLCTERGAPLDLAHCDVAPSNVMVGASGDVKLIDLGVAFAGGISLPREGDVGGKLRYAAPERARGAGFDRLSDIYAVGLVLWELLAGKRIYEGLGVDEIRTRSAFADVPPIESLRVDVPKELARILAHSLARQPQDRYPTATAFLDALEALPLSTRRRRSRAALAEIVRALAGVVR